ncbi:CocE/NonD family hydrolase [Rhodococcus sp. NPDC058521]|uniref:CocE/NonD family hydrolase n=1 Tax=Rhodococcus sp. NPDC058521 TaxID=3346536 RepID=UPI00366174EB
MRQGFRVLVSMLFVAAATALQAGALPAVGTAQPPGYTEQLLYFSVHVGPDESQPCTIVGQLVLPDSASESARVPAILTTNGFGGSYKGQIPLARTFAMNGYAALTYSGLGFGGSSCKISLDSPEYDGRAAAQLVSFLGGAEGIAFTDPELTQPFAPLRVVERDSRDNQGNSSVDDPRVGMVGGSYGGGVQFAAAATDPRIDTIVPMITWNDLPYSLTPNGTSVVSGASTAVPGAAKIMFASALFMSGVTNPQVAGYAADPARAADCPNFQPFMCTAITEAATIGNLDPAVTEQLRADSVVSYIDRINIPVLLAQGQKDTLFDLNEAVATYDELRTRGVETKMIWHSWGHSNLTPAPGEFSFTAPDPETQYETGRIFDWFDHHLKGTGTDTGPQFSYFRNWVEYDGNAEPAYASSSSYPVGVDREFHLSGDGRLVDSPVGVVPGATTITTGVAGLPTGLEAPDPKPADPVPSLALPGSQTGWTTKPLPDPLEVVGISTVTLRVRSPGQPVVFVKLYDVAEDGTATLINGLVMPVRITDPSAPVPVTLPAIVHRFDAGHSIRLEVAGGDVSFRGGLESTAVTLISEGSGPLVLPVTR